MQAVHRPSYPPAMAPKRRTTEAGLPVLRMRPIPKGRAVAQDALEDVRRLLADAPRRRDLLIEHLHRIQDTHGCLPTPHLVALASEMRLALAEVYEVATFYHHFDVVDVDAGESPPPPVTVRVCDSISCELAGAGDLITELKATLGSDVRVLPAPCIGQCDGAPAALVSTAAMADARKVGSDRRRSTEDAIEGPADETAAEAGRTVVVRAAARSARAATQGQRVDTAARGVREAVARQGAGRTAPEYRDLAAYRADGGYRCLVECARGERTLEQVTAAVAESGLRGLGGAGFPAARKWQFVRNEPGPRVLALNADEGEPGTFKDRYCLETDPHRVIEGMLIAAWAVGAGDVFVYLRDEYPAARAILERELDALRADPPCDLPAIHLRRGAGAYICGEETALIESVEGKRGEPRLRPPFPAQYGVFGLPTLVHNVETVYWLPEILERGAAWFANAGRAGHPGQRLWSVSGRVRRPGVYLAPNGTTARELVDEYAGGMLDGHRLYAYLPGGASGGILPARLADLPLDFGEPLSEHGCFVGSAAVVILSDRDSVKVAALNLMRFFAHESCGKCTPCRVGTSKAVELMKRQDWDQELLHDLSAVMADASICGLGQAAPNAMRCVGEYFADELRSPAE